MHVTNIHDSDDTLQVVALTAKCTIPMVLHEAKIDNDNNLGNNLESNLRGQGDEDSPIYYTIWDLHSQITDENHLDMPTQICLMLEMLLKYQA